MTAEENATGHTGRGDPAAARESRILTVGFLLNLAVGLVALTTGTIVDITTNSDAERAEWRDAVLTLVVVFDAVGIANIAAMYWYVQWRRSRRGIRQYPGDRDGRLTWVQGQVFAFSLVICYVMLFREKGGPLWILVLSALTAANALAAYVHSDRAVARTVKNAPRLL